MRMLAIFGLLALAGCLREPTGAELQLQSACEAGNTAACAEVVRTERAERQAIQELFSNRPQVYIPPVTYQPQQRLQAYCYTVGNTFNCY